MIYQGDYDPAVRVSNGKYKLSDIDPSTATNGQVLVYSTSSGTWGPGSAVSSALTDAHIFVGNGSAMATDVAVSGDLTLANTGAFTIANSAVSTAKIAANAVDGTKIAIASQVTGSIMYYNGTDWIQLAPGTDGQVLTLAAGVPTWA